MAQMDQKGVDSVLLEHPPQGTTSDTIKCLLQVHKTCEHIQRLEVVVADLIHPRSAATVELFNHLSDFSLDEERVQPRVPSLYFHQGICDGRIEEILEVLLSPPDKEPRRGRDVTISATGVTPTRDGTLQSRRKSSLSRGAGFQSPRCVWR
ncbi:hypothetical protein AMECASPLE_026493 [Ameca splendens]|uniref:Uncharacterized protein n=1 Tax=Ameca splendens TaxID=208324 RepID=A0ABV0YSJ8_9TELE